MPTAPAIAPQDNRYRASHHNKQDTGGSSTSRAGINTEPLIQGEATAAAAAKCYDTAEVAILSARLGSSASSIVKAATNDSNSDGSSRKARSLAEGVQATMPSLQQSLLSSDPCQYLRMSSQAPLLTAQRQPCPGCGKPRAFFCYDCLELLVPGAPRLELPCKIHIVMHGETNSQSTGIHAALLAPGSVTVWRHQDGTSHHRRQDGMSLPLPEFDPEATAVLFPEARSTPVVALWGHLAPSSGAPVAAAASGAGVECVEGDGFDRQLGPLKPVGRSTNSSNSSGCCFPYKEIILLEGSWAKAKGLLRHPCISGLPRVQLPTNARTLFWRRGEGSYRAAVDEGVCTIEAIHLLCKQLEPSREWDDLLWFFSHMRRMVVWKSSVKMLQLMQQHEARAICGAKMCRNEENAVL